MSITSYPRLSTASYFFQVGLGEVSGTSYIHKFGAVPEMSNNTSGSIWDVSDTLYPWSSWNTPTTVLVDRASTSDANKQIRIEGLDQNYELISDTVTLASATGNSSTVSFSRVYRAYVVGAVSENVGNIDIRVSTTVVARITAGKGQTLMAIYTVPANHTAYLMKGVATCEANADFSGDMYVRYFGSDAFRIGHAFEVSGSGGEYLYEFTVPIAIPEKSDIDVRATTRSNNARATAAFDIILVEND
jgi:hypothetical protein